MKNQDINIRDPFVLPFKGKYYMYGTRGETAFADEAFGLDVYVSEDLEDWSEPHECFRRPEGFWADRHYWAPEVHIYKGGIYMFATFSDGRKQGTAILRADSPLGPFRQWSDGPVTPENWSSLDGTLYISGKGEPYMVFCHEWVDIRDGTVCAMRLTEDLKAACSEPVTLFRATDGKPAVHPFFDDNYVTDGPFLLRTDDERLHMLWASYGADGEYLQLTAHSDNNEIDGKWTVDRELLFLDDGGHGMVFRSFSGELMLALHSPNTLLAEHPVFFKMAYDKKFMI